MTTYGRGLRGLSLATAATITVALALTFFYAPLDANQGFIQKIFYIHVPLAITALCGFVFGGVLGDRCTCARAIASGTCAPTSRSTWR